VQSQPSEKPIYFETNILPTDSGNICFISYKVPFDNLFFVKEGNKYTSGIRVTLEGKPADDSRIIRKSSSETVITGDYKITESDDVYLEGLLEFQLDPGKYKFTPVVDLDNTDDTYTLKSFDFTVDKTDSGVVRPIVSRFDRIVCNGDTLWKLTNFENGIPYSNEPYSLLISLHKAEPDSLRVKISQDDNVKVKTTLKKRIDGMPELQMCDRKLSAGVKKVSGYSFFVLERFNYDLDYGKADIEIKYGDEKSSFTIPVRWLNKPRSLNDIDLAVDLVERFQEDDAVNEIYEFPEEQQFKALIDYWKKYDKNNKTAFNEVMNEFYTRVDYAAQEYKTADNKPGFKTDRGEIYIKYGKPDEIERTYSEQYNTVEIWKYNKLSREFYFADKSGLGEYKLLD
jgi:GWxTD domain-containing protein